MRKHVAHLLLPVALAGCWILGCAKPPATETTPPTKAPEVVKAPETNHVHGDGMLADKAPKEAQTLVNPVKADAASLEQGKKLFAANCASCHGEKGDGKGPQSVGLKPTPANFTDKEMMAHHTDGVLYWAITNGGGPMPPYGKTLSDEERWHLVNFIRSLGK